MKKLIIISILAVALAACAQKTNENSKVASSSPTEEHHDADHHHDEAEEAHDTTKTSESATPTQSASTPQNNPLASVYNAYFELKNALTKDDGKGAQTSAKALYDNISKIQPSTLTAEQSTVWTKYKNKLSFDAEHIKGVDENDHQREHFVSLSKNMHEVIKAIKNDKTVYYQNCPMYNNGKGGNWLSMEDKISNPYYGKSMPKCGKTIETIK